MSHYKSIDVEISLDEWDDDELIRELELRKSDYRGATDADLIKDDIFELYMLWLDDKGDRDNRFEKAMRVFFAKHLDKVSV